MKKINYWLAGSTAAMLLASAPLLASAHDGISAELNAKAAAQMQAGAHGDNGLHLGVLASVFAKGQKGDNDNDGDDNNKKGDHASTTPEHRALMAHNFLSAIGMAGGGVVTSVGTSTFTIKSFGTKATTTVATDASTVFKLNGQTASSSALSVGSHVLVAGTSTNQTSIGATLVSIFTAGFGWFHHLFR